jgi:general secretion pathway protein M
MTAAGTIDRYMTRYPALAILAYAVMVVALVWIAWSAVTDILARRAAVEASADMLARLEGRSINRNPDGTTKEEAAPAGSPFLEGQTVTVAGAALLQRIATAVTKVGGNVLSSQVELQGTQAKDGYISLIASCEVDQTMLQQLLYDIEAGMPFLFLDQLSIQAPTAPGEGSRMRVLLGVSGLWPGAK